MEDSVAQSDESSERVTCTMSKDKASLVCDGEVLVIELPGSDVKNGVDGKDGADGKDGENGKDGSDGTSCEGKVL
ncbi:MAG: hypothetical protein HUK20_13670, partial [Fibrobacter sp.]|nr:hypothetical protein [Fibrobacter sp.]